MNYSSYLFNQLLSEYNTDFNNLPYDEKYTTHIDLLIEFENSEFNSINDTEYDCICRFLNFKNTEKLIF